jgi:hypothetical protein
VGAGSLWPTRTPMRVAKICSHIVKPICRAKIAYMLLSRLGKYIIPPNVAGVAETSPIVVNCHFQIRDETVNGLILNLPIQNPLRHNLATATIQQPKPHKL